MKPIRIVFVAVALLIAPTSSQTGDCDLPSETDVQTVGTQILNEAQTEGNAEPDVSLLNMTFTCLARVSFDKYKTANVIAYTSTIYGNKAAKVELNQFTLQCSLQNTWKAHTVGNHDKTIPEMQFDIKTEYRCAECTVVSQSSSLTYNSTINCLYCHSTCLEKGQGLCSGYLPTHCCPYFNSDTGLCVDDCRTINPKFGPNATFHCVCIISCLPGYTKNTAECICELTDGCEAAGQPCKNGGTCTSHLPSSSSSYYSCQCAAGYRGHNCDIATDCGPGCMDGHCDTTTGCCANCRKGHNLVNSCSCVKSPTTEPSNRPTVPTGVCPSTCRECELDNPTCCSLCPDGLVVHLCECLEEKGAAAASSHSAGITIGVLLFTLLVMALVVVLTYLLYYLWANKTRHHTPHIEKQSLKIDAEEDEEETK